MFKKILIFSVAFISIFNSVLAGGLTVPASINMTDVKVGEIVNATIAITNLNSTFNTYCCAPQTMSSNFNENDRTYCSPTFFTCGSDTTPVNAHISINIPFKISSPGGYYLNVKVYNVLNNSEYYICRISGNATLLPPTNLKALNVTDKSATLNWSDGNPGSTAPKEFQNYVGTTLAVKTNSTATNVSLKPNTTNTVYVKEAIAGIVSTNSNIVTVNTLPSVPANLSLSYSLGILTVSWSAPIGGCVGYKISKDNMFVVAVNNSVLSYSFNVCPGSTPRIDVAAYNNYGTSQKASKTIAIRPLSIDGPSVIPINGSSYYVLEIPKNVVVKWTYSSNLKGVYGGNNFVALVPLTDMHGSGWVKAEVPMPNCGTYSLTYNITLP